MGTSKGQTYLSHWLRPTLCLECYTDLQAKSSGHSATMARQLHPFIAEDVVNIKKCIQCEKPLSLLKRVSGASFCSPAHRVEFEARMRELQLQRLAQATRGFPAAGVCQHEPAYQ